MPGIFHQAGCCCAARWKLVPCFEGTGACDDCDPAPEYLTVQLVNTTPCDGCLYIIPTDSYRLVTRPDINGKYLLPLTVGDCTWGGSFTVIGGQLLYDDINCTVNEAPSCNYTEIDIEVTAVGGSWIGTIDDVCQVPRIGPDGWASLPGTIEDCEDKGFVILYPDTDSDDALDCEDPTSVNWYGGTMVVWFGDIDDPNTRCPGGFDPYYTNSDLSSYEGKIITIEEDPNICYRVTQNTDDDLADGNATKIDCWTTCQKCCDEDPTDC